MNKIKTQLTTLRGMFLSLFAFFLIIFSCVVPKEYTSSSVFIVKSLSEDPVPTTGLELISTSIPTNSTTPIIEAFVGSPSLANMLNEDLGYFGHIREGQGVFSYLMYSSGLDEYFEKTTEFVELKTGNSDDVLLLATTAFSKDMALNVNKRTMRAIEDLIERVNEEKVGAKLSNAQKVVTETQYDLTKANIALDNYRSENNVLSPTANVEISRGHVAALEQSLVLAKAEYQEKSTYLTPAASEIITLKARIAALEVRVLEENEILISSSSSHNYLELQLAVDLANQGNQIAIASLEQIRMDAFKNTVTLIKVSESTTPTKATYPSVLYDALNMTVIFIVLIIVFRMVREQTLESKKS